MKRSTKILSALLAALMLISSAAVGIVGAAQETGLSEKYDELAELLSNEYVRDTSNYSVTNYTDEDDLIPNGGYKVYSTVTARDNLNGDITLAAQKFYEIANLIKSTEYGVGSYNAVMIANEIKQELALRMGDTITVMEPYREEIPVQKEVSVVVEDPNNPGTYIQTTEVRTVMEYVTLYKPVDYERYLYYNVSAILTNFIAGQLGVSVVNWYYDYSFVVQTDIDEALMAYESVESLPNSINVRYTKYTWKHARITNEKGTVVNYVLSDIITEAPQGAPYNYQEINVQVALQQANMNLFGATSQLLTRDYSGYTTAQLATERNTYKPYVEDLLQHSDKLLVHFFGDKIANLMNWYYSTEMPFTYPITREVTEGVTYSATLSRLNQTVDKIDSLLLSNDVGTLLNSFIDTSSDDYEDSPIYGLKYTNGKELIEVLLKDFIFRDNIVTSLFLMLYPMVYEMLEDMADTLDNYTIGLYKELRDEGIYLQYQYVRDRLPAKYSNIKNHMNAAISQGYVTDPNKWVGFEEYLESLPKGVELDWGVDSAYDQKTAFINAMGAIFAPVEPLLWTLLGDVKLYIELAGQLAYVSVQRIEAYQKLIIPLFETLGITNFISWNDFKALRSHTDIMGAILNPIIDWVLNDVASKPISTITSILPNLSIFLTAKNGVSPVQNIINNINIHLEAKVSGIVVYNYDMPLRDVVDDFYPNLGGGINGVLKLVGGDDEDEEEEEDGFNIKYLPPILDRVLHTRGQIITNKVFPSGTQTRDVVVVYDQATGVDFRGQVLFAMLRWLLTGINYRAYNQNAQTWASKTLLESFGLDIADLDAQLGDLLGLPVTSKVAAEAIAGVAIHPNDVILALEEFFFPNENGKYPTDGSYVSNPYKYPMQEITYSPAIVEAKSFGASAQYSDIWTKEKATYLAAAIPVLTERMLKVLKIEGLTDLEQYVNDMLAENVFSQEMLTNIAMMVYPAITELNIDAILSVAAGLDYTPKTIAERMAYLNTRAGRPASEVQLALQNVARPDWENNLAYSNVYNKWDPALLFEHSFMPYIETVLEVNPETGEVETRTENNHVVVATSDRPLDWGFEDGDRAAWLDNLVALLSPFADIIQLLLADRDLNLVDLVHIPGYAGYQYAIIPLLEALSCQNVKTYAQYKAAISNPTTGAIDTFYLILNPLLSLFDRFISNPIGTALDILPNLMYFISIGGLNIVLNNLIHVVYVLLDILSPIIDATPLVNKFLQNLEIGGVKLGLSLPLELNINQLVDNIFAGFIGDGIEVGGSSVKLMLKLPNVDVTMLASGEPVYYEQRKGNKTMSRTMRPGVIYIQGDNGADLLTVLLKYVLSVLFYSENAEALGEYCTKYFSLSEEDSATLFEVLRYFNTQVNENNADEQILSMMYTVIQMIFPYTQDIVEMFENSQYGLMDLISELPNVFEGDTSGLMLIINDIRGNIPSDPDSPLTMFGSIIQLLKDFFAKIKIFFETIFSR